MQSPDEDVVDRGAVVDAGGGAVRSSPTSTGVPGAGPIRVTTSGGAPGTSGGSGGTAGTASGGAAGTSPFVCPAGGALDCAGSQAMRLADGQITDFSPREWNPTTGQFCNPDGLRGRLFSFAGSPASSAAVVVDQPAQALTLDLTAKDWAGGGLIFESCVDASTFKGVQFRATVTAGSLAGCYWQVQVQTQDQRANTDTDPTGGTCTSRCYAYPLVVLPDPGTAGAVYTEGFSVFNNPTGSQIPTESQVVGLQWQITSASSEGCRVELRIESISFQ